MDMTKKEREERRREESIRLQRKLSEFGVETFGYGSPLAETSWRFGAVAMTPEAAQKLAEHLQFLVDDILRLEDKLRRS